VKENYQNLKTQCEYMFAAKVEARAIRVVLPDKFSHKVKRDITAELEQIRRADSEKEGVLKTIPKEERKAALGRSPDFSDSLIMRIYFELHKSGGVGAVQKKVRRYFG